MNTTQIFPRAAGCHAETLQSFKLPVPPSSRSKIRRRLPEVLLAFYILSWLFLAIRPTDRLTWLFENLLVFAVMPVLICTYKRFRFSNFSYVLMAAFLILHAIGAHYTYSETPLGNWFRDQWGLTRNHYDRIVHFIFGLLVTFPLWEFVNRRLGQSARFSSLLAVHLIVAWSAIYELLEALVAHLVSPALGAAYNGAQGDEWDPQKDMVLSLCGSLLALLIAAICRARTSCRERCPDRAESQ